MRSLPAILALLFLPAITSAQMPTPTLKPSMRTVDLDVGESAKVTMPDGKVVTVKLVELKEASDPLRNAVRIAEAMVAIDGKIATVVSANYRLPAQVGGAQIDCPVTRGYVQNATKGLAGDNPWGLDKDARIRVFPAGAPLLEPNTFKYPARQRWFASGTQMANEP